MSANFAAVRYSATFMPLSCLKVARGLLLYGEQIQEGALDREAFMKKIAVRDGSFRSAGMDLGATIKTPGLRFFSASPEKIAFGPGAGLVVGVSVGVASLRAVLVDANGWVHHVHECDPVQEQLMLDPSELLERIQLAAGVVLSEALINPQLLVGGRLPLLGISVAWCVPMDRRKRPIGSALGSRMWHNDQGLDKRVATHLGIAPKRSHALADTHAAAIAFAFAQTRRREHVKQRHPRLAIVLRLAGAVGGAIIGVERPEEDAELGPTSGFVKSILIGAGEFAHMPLKPSTVQTYAAPGVPGLGDLVACRCSCTDASGEAPDHLEAYTGAAAVAARIAPDEPVCVVVRRIIRDPDRPEHRRALEDLASLLGHALLGPVALVNPATIALTGTFAVPTVRMKLAAELATARALGDAPPIEFVSCGTDVDATVDDRDIGGTTAEQFTRARGAALVVLRRHVHRELAELVGDRAAATTKNVKALTSPLAGLPW